MTLIACFSADAYPAFIGDALLSSPCGKDNIFLPTTGQQTSQTIVLGKYKIHGTTQKIKVFKNKLIVAWSGSQAAANRILQTIEKISKEISCDALFIEKWLIANHANDLASTHLIIGSIDQKLMGMWSNNCEELITPTSKIWTTGSGKHILKEHLRYNPLLAQPASALNSIMLAIGTAGALLSEEIHSQRTIESGFGGFYQIAAFADYEAKYISDIVYIFWNIEVNKSEVKISPPHKVIKTINLPEHQCIYSVNYKHTKQGHSTKENESYLVDSRETAALVKNRRNENLNSLWQANIFRINGLNGGLRILTSHLKHPCEFSNEGFSCDYKIIQKSLDNAGL